MSGLQLSDIPEDEKGNVFENFLVFPEMTRLNSFIKELENQLESATTEKNMFKVVSLEIDTCFPNYEKELENELEELHSYDEIKEVQYQDLPVTPINELYKGFTPHKTPLLQSKTQSNLDIFLLTLAEAGYANVEPGNVRNDMSSGYTTVVNEFFDSALDSGDHSPILPPCVSQPFSVAPSMTDFSKHQSNRPLRFGREDMTAESLRKNWDLDDDEEDGSSGGEISPKSPLLTTEKISKANSSMQFPDLMSSPSPTSPFLAKNSTNSNTKPLIDPRLHGDFNVWSGGPMLSAEAIHREYLGLHPTALTHHLLDGKLIPCHDLSERLAAATCPMTGKVRNFYSGPYDIQSILGSNFKAVDIQSPVMPSIYAHHNQQLRSEANPSNSSSSQRNRRNSNAQSHHTQQQPQQVVPFYYNRHVMECVLRPDKELKHILLSLCRFFFDREYVCQQLQSNHLVIFSNPTPTPVVGKIQDNQVSTDLEELSTSLQTFSWDMIDIQVCLSRELKQRVLLVQFLHKVPFSLFEAMGFGTLGIISTNTVGSGTNVSSGGSVIITTGILPDTLPLRACPITRKLAVQMKKMLIAEQLSLSALYMAPIPEVCALPKGLDTHFLALLQSLTREQLWKRLKCEYRTMDDHIKVLEDKTNEFAKLLEPIYKAYGMPIQDMQFKHRPSREQQQKQPLLSVAIKSSNMEAPSQVLRSNDARKDAVSFSFLEAVIDEDKLVTIHKPFLTTGIAASTSSSTNVTANTVFNMNLTEPNSLPPSALKDTAGNSLSPKKTSNRSVTIRLDTNTIHYAASPVPNSQQEVGFSTPQRCNMTNNDTVSPTSEKEENMDTPISALTATPQTPPRTPDDQIQQLLLTHRDETDDHNDSMSTVSLASKFSMFSNDTNQRKKQSLTLMTGPVSPSTAKVIMQADMSPASVKVRLQEQYAQNSKVDGMVFYLIMRDKIFQEMQHSCDQEYAERMCNRHNSTLLTVQDLTSHKKTLLMVMLNNQQNIQKSLLMKTFTTAFQGVSVTRWVSPQYIVSAGTIARDSSELDETTTPLSKVTVTASSTKSFFSSFFGNNSSTIAVKNATTNKNNNNNNNNNNNSTSATRNNNVCFSNGHNLDKNITSSSNCETTAVVSVTSTFPIQEEIVLYYFTMLTHGGQQGTVYLTPRYICIVSSLMGFMNMKKEIFLFADLTECSVTTSGEALIQRQLQQQQVSEENAKSSPASGGEDNTIGGVAAGLFGGLKLLKLVWQHGQREILVRPLLVDAHRIQSLFNEIMTIFKPAADTNMSTI